MFILKTRGTTSLENRKKPIASNMSTLQNFAGSQTYRNTN